MTVNEGFRGPLQRAIILAPASRLESVSHESLLGFDDPPLAAPVNDLPALEREYDVLTTPRSPGEEQGDHFCGFAVERPRTFRRNVPTLPG